MLGVASEGPRRPWPLALALSIVVYASVPHLGGRPASSAESDSQANGKSIESAAQMCLQLSGAMGRTSWTCRPSRREADLARGSLCSGMEKGLKGKVRDCHGSPWRKRASF